eukprot:comp23166_c8_seq1/m.37501 comp23166_c8_seq1/g.37501  ORF comp23166_c8_seq1/g.37501 comp23166_c8_seq1/m.37501 type:complete len:203 (-) comp23166_c8_seq1:433-1041(-)
MDRLRLRVEGEVGGAPLRCWYLADAQLCPTVDSLAQALAQKLGLPPVRIYMDGFLVPPFEPTTLLRDGDLIRIEASSSTHAFPLHNTPTGRESEPTRTKRSVESDSTVKRKSEIDGSDERPTKKRKGEKESVTNEKEREVKKTEKSKVKEARKRETPNEEKGKEKGSSKKVKNDGEKGVKEWKKTEKGTEEKTEVSKKREQR